MKTIPTSNYDELVIGDVHGLINGYYKILQKHKNLSSTQVGDFGFKTQHEWHRLNINPKQHKVNFGNHDDYSFLNAPHSLGNFSISKKGIMSIRGAYSIDQHNRTENIDWWRNEELDYSQMNAAIDLCLENKPRVLITHDCPHEVRKHLFGIPEKSITSNGLQALFEVHQPDLWIFGHHHRSKNEVINGTRFICLAELESIVI